MQTQAGDKNGIIVVSGNMGNLLREEGRLTEALVSYNNALSLSNELGHRGSGALCLQAMGDLQAEKGDLPGALENYRRAMVIQQEVGAKSNYASSLTSEGEVFRQQGELSRALKIDQEALTLQQQLGEQESAAESQLALAEVAYDSRKPAEAEALARRALDEFRAQREPVSEIAAGGLLSRSLLDQGKLSEAQESIIEATRLAEKTPDAISRLSLTVDSAYVLAAEKKTVAARIAARQVSTEAQKLGFVRLCLEASLALGQIQMRSGGTTEGRVRLQRLEKDARAKGFMLIAQAASRSLLSPMGLPQ
jgi:tetratricopeptide (TPR) repeat protein